MDHESTNKLEKLCENTLRWDINIYLSGKGTVTALQEFVYHTIQLEKQIALVQYFVLSF